MEEYCKLQFIFAKEKCILCSSKQDIEKQRISGTSFSKLKCCYNAQCGHKNTVTLSNFIYRQSGRKCKDCTFDIVRNKHEHTHKSAQLHNETSLYTKQEQDTMVNICNNKLKNDFDFHFACEGCRFDFIIKPKCIESDKWLPIQLKTTQKRTYGQYGFTLKNDYHGIIMMFFCINEELWWIVPFEKLVFLDSKKTRHHINIRSGEKNKMNEFFVDSNLVIEKLSKLYFKHTSFVTKEDARMPQTKCQMIEKKYSLIRRNAFANIYTFNEPEYHQSHHDFCINGFKIQEKVATKRDDKPGFFTHIGRNCRNRKTPYKQGMCDFYYIHISDHDIFYLFPESVLIDRGFIETDKQKGKTALYISPLYAYGWYNDPKYKHNYKTSNLQLLFQDNENK